MVATQVCQNRPVLQCLVNLLGVPDIEAVLGSLQILQAMYRSPEGSTELCIEIGMMDKLDEIMYSSGSDSIYQFAKRLTDEVFDEEEGAEESDAVIMSALSGIADNIGAM